MSIVYNYMLYFFIYSFLGWVCESIYCSCLQKKIINRGFLNGPVCPVYGVGALIIIIGCWSYRDSMIGVFISGMILTSMLEYITATILEKLFHAKWWDYSNHKCNINGKVCLLNSTMFGIMSVFVVEFLHPFIINNLEKMLKEGNFTQNNNSAAISQKAENKTKEKPAIRLKPIKGWNDIIENFKTQGKIMLYTNLMNTSLG